eukprot:Plantae.Rhodophyta-Hildenbrandia_rubra.ctg4159.p1 GENE.Plantae.Rhodophyta-Hildenbrandia_rubra.ctg4159~~Plantae.Rhodophyta-Hildenbrandia_rubra.ctg4159.p1  ORF type:complete len:330 (+),score=57.85 Plantae.Rhodophyta-Hildenbrandia_rubra.ctg4159:2041-3030(+)
MLLDRVRPARHLYPSSEQTSMKSSMTTAFVVGGTFPGSGIGPLIGQGTRCSAFCGRRLAAPALRARVMVDFERKTSTIQMNLFERFFRVIRATINQLVSGMEDPEKILNQTVTDMQGDLVKVRQAYAEVSASKKRLERQKEQAQVTSREWYKRAQLALQKGEEGLAREALTRKKGADDMVKSTQSQMDLMKTNVDKLYSSMQQLEGKISEARTKKDQFVARARTAKTSQKINEMMSSVSTSGALEAFERMKTKVEELEVKADVSRELSIGGAGDASVENKFRALESDDVDDELAKMKGQLAGATPFSLPSRVSDPEVEGELERMKRNRG